MSSDRLVDMSDVGASVARKDRYALAENEQLSKSRRFAPYSTGAGSNGAPVFTFWIARL